MRPHSLPDHFMQATSRWGEDTGLNHCESCSGVTLKSYKCALNWLKALTLPKMNYYNIYIFSYTDILKGLCVCANTGFLIYFLLNDIPLGSLFSRSHLLLHNELSRFTQFTKWLEKTKRSVDTRWSDWLGWSHTTLHECTKTEATRGSTVGWKKGKWKTQVDFF